MPSLTCSPSGGDVDVACVCSLDNGLEIAVEMLELLEVSLIWVVWILQADAHEPQRAGSINPGSDLRTRKVTIRACSPDDVCFGERRVV